MKKFTPYILGGLAFIALLVLLMSTRRKTPHKMDERITLRYKDKIPYGLNAAYTLLPQLFPHTAVFTDKRSPGTWDSLSFTGTNQAAILVGVDIAPDNEELGKMLHFAERGNYVMLICRSLSYDAKEYFGVKEYYDVAATEVFYKKNDSLEVTLDPVLFGRSARYVYPGRNFASAFSGIDTGRTIILGRNKTGQPNFVQLNKGKGSIFIHTAPLAFSNYFILHKNNIGYFERALSVLPPSIHKIVWNEYYLTRRQPEKEPNWLGVLLRYEAFKWALLTALVTSLIFVLLEMRRKQRIIPVMEKPVNESLDFVKTIGRLYYDKRDHKNLATKMAVYFLDNIRNRFKLATGTLDDEFVQALHQKTGYPVAELKKLTLFIYHLGLVSQISEGELNTFYNGLESFYQNT